MSGPTLDQLQREDDYQFERRAREALAAEVQQVD